MPETIIHASRDDLPLSLVDLGLTTVGVEVGTYEGVYAKTWLEHWPGKLHCVDPYIHQPGWKDCLNGDEDHWTRVLDTAVDRLAPWLRTGRCVMHILSSPDAASFWWAKDLDFVYLDAKHDGGSVTADLEAWWPTIKPGGVFAGHDYLDGTIGNPPNETHFGVKSAVQAWVQKIGYNLSDISVTDDGTYPTWFLRKRASDGQ